MFWFLVYFAGGTVTYFTVPYRHDVPATDRLILSVLWLPAIGLLTISRAAEWIRLRF